MKKLFIALAVVGLCVSFTASKQAVAAAPIAIDCDHCKKDHKCDDKCKADKKKKCKKAKGSASVSGKAGCTHAKTSAASTKAGCSHGKAKGCCKKGGAKGKACSHGKTTKADPADSHEGHNH